MIEEVQVELDRFLDDRANGLIENLDGIAERIQTKIWRTRSDIYDILSDYAKADNTISTSRLNSMTKDFDEVELAIYLDFLDEMEAELTKTVEQANEDSIMALVAVLGISVPTISITLIVKEVLDYVMNREVGGITLNERIRSYAGFLRDEIQQAVRYGVRRLETIGVLSRRVRDAFGSTLWQVARIVKTEILIAYRRTIAFIGEKLGIVKAVKIIDNRGRHRYHETHECYRLAEQDMYGWGKGVYRPQDTFIFDPHPQCTAYYRYILDEDELIKGGAI